MFQAKDSCTSPSNQLYAECQKMNELKTELLTALKDIQENGPDCPNTGICDNIMYANFGRLDRFSCNLELTTLLDGVLTDLTKRWPEYSGESRFPVPHPTMDPIAAYGTTTNVWIGEFGMARRRLLSFLIHELEKELA